MANFDVNNISVSSILGYIKDGTIAIPEIQRPFVWDSVKVRDLIDSLYNGYPVGYIITWKSHNVKLKDGTSSEGKQILIDGQQRITALTASLLGQEVLDSTYKKKKVIISFNIKNEEFATKTPATEKSEEWITNIADFMDPGKINIWEYTNEYAQKFEMDANVVSQRINKLMQIKNAMIGRIELSSELPIDIVTEIFVRINSKGQPLSSADFAMSKISVNEEFNGNNIRKMIDYFCHLSQTPEDYQNIMDNDIDFYKTEYFNKIKWIKDDDNTVYLPSYTDVLRVAFTYKFKRGKLEDLVSLLSGRDFETREYKEEIIESSFKTLEEGVMQYVNQTNFQRYLMILQSAGIIDESLVRSQNVLDFGYILYLLLKEKGIEESQIQHEVKKWVIMSIITQRYTSSPESMFDYDIRRLNGAENILSYMHEEEERQLSSAFWNSILVERLNTSVSSSPYWKTFQIAQIKLHNRGFLSESIDVYSLSNQRGDIHHIFPKDYLKKSGLDNRQEYNQIANYAMLEQEVNIAISNRAPNDYFKYIFEKQCNGAEHKYGSICNIEDLKKNMQENAIPEGLENMDYNDYEGFLAKRRILMANKIREYYESL